jgi:hypothetical protein
MTRTILVSVTALLFAAPGIAAAGDFDGSKTLLCAPTDANQCEGAGTCSRTEVEALNIPKFVTIDFEAKKLSGKREGQDEVKSTPIKAITKMGGQTVLQGAENGRGFSIVIDGATGDMTAAIAGDDLGFVLFGVCTPR